MDLNDKVINLIEGKETYKEIHIYDGQAHEVERIGLTAERWVKRAYEYRALTGYQLLAVVYFALHEIGNVNRDRKRIVPQWANAITKAIESGKIVPLDPDSYLPLENPPQADEWNWLVDLSIADSFVSSYVELTCTHILKHLINEIYPNNMQEQTDITSSKKESIRKTENLCRAIACLAIDGYGYNPNDPKSNVPKELSGIMSKKFDVEISDRTIRNWIKEGLENIRINQHIS